MPTSPLAHIPTGEVAIPPQVADLAAGASITAVWRNELGGLTFRIGAGTPSERFVKWVLHGTPELDLTAEAERLRWARNWVTVPEVIELNSDDTASWMVTKALPGKSAVDPRWIREPPTAATAIGHGLRAFHDSIPVQECPYLWSTQQRIQQFVDNLANGMGPERWSPEHRNMPVEEAHALALQVPEIDRLVVCHADACAPNTLINDDGSFLGHVDLGTMGVADRWADLAVAAWSTEWNYGPGYDHLVYQGYGIRPDPERIAYYRLLWDLA